MKHILPSGIFIAAFISSVFWLLSARVSAPMMTFSGIGELPKYFNRVGRYNFLAAIFAAVSAMLTGIASLLQACQP